MIDIRTNQLNNDQVIALLQEHHNDMLNHSPVESVHALDISGLLAPDVAFFSLWIDDKPAGICALKALDESHCEIKSMRTSPQFLRRGVAKKLLDHVIEQAKIRGYQRISLETGTAQAFLPAQKMYQSFGFIKCEPFSGYSLDPYSLFMTKKISGA